MLERLSDRHRAGTCCGSTQLALSVALLDRVSCADMDDTDCWSLVVRHLPPHDRLVVVSLCKDMERAFCCADSHVPDNVAFGIYSCRMRVLPALRAMGARVFNQTIVYNGMAYLCEAPVGCRDEWASFTLALSTRHRLVVAAAAN